MLSAPEDESQVPGGTGGRGSTDAAGSTRGAGGAGGGGYGTSGGASAAGNPASTCIGSCSATAANTASNTTLGTGTASAATTSIPAGTGTGTATATATGPTAFTVGAGGYVTSGPWQGYAWTATETPSLGSVIAPTSFSLLPPGSQLCVQGSVAPSSVWAGIAMLGLNVNQSKYGVEDLWNPDSDGLAFDVTNSGNSPLRIQIQGALGWPSQAWCAVITGASGNIPWGRFNSACWDGTGSTYDGTPLQNVMIMVPGSNVYPIPFSFCLNSIGPA